MVTVEKMLEHADVMVARAERPDLAQRLANASRRWQDPSIRVFVVGEFKQGKSTLVNALINAPLCPVGTDVTTSVATMVSAGDEPSAELVYSAPSLPGHEEAPRLRRVPIPIDEVAQHVSQRHNPDNTSHLLYVHARLPRPLLADGLTLVDTPGVGGLNSSHAAATMSALPQADALLFVSDGSAEYSDAELEFLAAALRLCPNAAAVMTKTDLYPEWRRIVEINRGHLARAGLAMPLIPVSARLRLIAARTNDATLNEESGFSALVRHLRLDVVGNARALGATAAANDVMGVVENLRAQWQPELAAYNDPQSLPRITAELDTAKARAQELKERSSRWQITLSDGIADIVSDLEHDLRERLRAVGREAEASIDMGDPGQDWEQVTAWLDERIQLALSETFVWAEDSLAWLADQVAQHFEASAHDTLVGIDVGNTGGLLDRVTGLGDLDRHEVSPLQKVLIGMRGSYGGVLMFGLLTGFAGMALLNPISLGAGILLGGRTYLDDKENRLRARRAEAKNLVRRRIDDTIFQVNKNLKDRLRWAQRQIRDHYTTVASELHTSLAESMKVAVATATASKVERERRVPWLTKQLSLLDQLAREAAELGGPLPRPAEASA
nr:Isoniazid-inducible protein iniA [Propionibacterium sp.]